MSGRRAFQVCMMMGGLLVWAMQFTVLYGVTSTLCGRGWAGASLFGIGVVQITIVVTTIAALGVTALLLLSSLRQYQAAPDLPVPQVDAFMNHATFLISSFSLVTIAWHGLPAFILPTCA